MTRFLRSTFAVTTVATLAACSGDVASRAEAATTVAAPPNVAVLDTTIRDVTSYPGTASALRDATLSTKLMGTVDAVLVREGQRVAAGTPLVRLDARDLDAKQTQAAAGLATAEAAQREALQHATRIRALLADSAATPSQLDQAEAGLARATAAVGQARGALAELRANADYAVIRAPFAGVITRRHVDPGAFAAPGAPLVSIIDDAALRVRAEVPLEAARTLRAGAPIEVHLAGVSTRATIEGIAPAAGNLYVVNVLVQNGNRTLLPGTPATLDLGHGTRRALLVPVTTLVRNGDLVGVDLVGAAGTTRRWVRLGATRSDRVEVLAGLSAGDRVAITTDGAR
jgi:RND family efflux transporter MFP subunit